MIAELLSSDGLGALAIIIVGSAVTLWIILKVIGSVGRSVGLGGGRRRGRGGDIIIKRR
ncbi:hypothetical protein [Mycobacteroides abscessus]|uniref:hypothetical protein n=1 Tax=Mycobacteroides abscessus TaxID=36809 RepID=UPI0019CF8502|nr:hypothetical protein [Mycobacteroides abscessus]MBN7457554.1 hypothetical protein [Mycobacteroides abscessus subsp. abscessus]